MKRKSIKLLTLALGLLLVFACFPALAGAAEGSGPTESQWWNLLYRFLNFAVLFGVLFVLVRKPISKFFGGRRDNIARTLEYLETQARNLEEQNELLGRKIADIAAEREGVLDQYKRMGQKEHDRIIAEAQITAKAIVEKTEAAMDQEMRAARQLLVDEIVRLATAMATDLTIKSIDAEDHKRLTRDFMAQVEKLPLNN